MRGEPSRGAGRSNPPLLLREPRGYTGARWSDVTKMLLEYGAAAHSPGASHACARWRGSRSPAPRRSRRRRANPVAWASRPRSSGDLYKCTTASGSEAFFNVPNNSGGGASVAPRRTESKPTVSAPTTAPTGFPRVDPETQKGSRRSSPQGTQSTSCPRRRRRSPMRASPTTAARPNRWPRRKADAEKYRAAHRAPARSGCCSIKRNVEALKKELEHDALSAPPTQVGARDRQFAHPARLLLSLQHGFARAPERAMRTWS